MKNHRISLRADRLVKRYGGLLAINGISFNLRAGEVTALLGANGSGKSTTIKIVCGLIEAGGGTVEYEGRSVAANAVWYKRLLGYVPEEQAVYTYLSGLEYLELVGRLRGLSKSVLRAKVSRCLDAFGIAHARFQDLSSYSKGMRQKVLLTAALIHNPEIVILDEPFSGLDVKAALVVRHLLCALADGGKTVLLSSHSVPVVTAVASRLIVIGDGRVTFDGAFDNFVTRTPTDSVGPGWELTGDDGDRDSIVSELLSAITL